ncbi:MAG: RDD family protein [Planctomyces sp.]|jgi:uncharacterized RDD family membrane protein YckC
MSSQDPFANNPFAAPMSLNDPALAASIELVPAGFLTRFLAAFVDGIITSIVGVVVGIGVGVTIGGDASGQAISQLLGLLIGWIYSAGMEGSSLQATPGKMLLGIQVVDLEGRQISFGRASGRHFAKILSTIILMIGFLMALFTQRKQALHDIIAGCLVVKRPDR